MDKDTSNWFSSWYNTPYYHILYKDKDHSESKAFMETLTDYLNLPEDASILEVRCVKGHHAIHLNNLGYDVTGVDISENNIEEAKKHENDRLRFDIHDMSLPYKHQFDAVFNLFNNFGYNDIYEDPLNIIKAIKANLNETGFGVIDFMNSFVAIENLVPQETITVEQIDFHLKHFVENRYIIKDVTFEDNGELHHYQERVRAFSLKDFEILFEQADTYLLDVFGDYKLNKFRPQTSERLVMIFK